MPLNDNEELLSQSSSHGTLVGIPPAIPQEPAAPRTRRILVTDDSSINRQILCRMLSTSLPKLFPKDTWIVEEAGDGTEAVDAIARDLAESEDGTGMVELIFMDIVSCESPSQPFQHPDPLVLHHPRSCREWTDTGPQERSGSCFRRFRKERESRSWLRAPTRSPMTIATKSGRVRELTSTSSSRLERQTLKKCWKGIVARSNTRLSYV